MVGASTSLMLLLLRLFLSRVVEDGPTKAAAKTEVPSRRRSPRKKVQETMGPIILLLLLTRLLTADREEEEECNWVFVVGVLRKELLLLVLPV